MNRFEEKVILITGAPGGLGSATAMRLAAEGGVIAVNYLDEGDIQKQAAALVDELQSAYGGNHRAYAADITDPEQVDAMVEAIIADYGRIDVLVNNAGISRNSMSWKYPESDWEKVIGVNLTGAFHCVRSVLPHMRKQRYGRIINISSVVGVTGSVGTVAYGASKAGLIGMMNVVAREVCTYGITINCIAPGYIDAGIIADVPDKYRESAVLPAIPMGRLGEPEDVAAAVAYLGSEDAKYVLGQVLRVDGGFAM